MEIQNNRGRSCMFLGITSKFDKQKKFAALCGCGERQLSRYGVYHTGVMGCNWPKFNYELYT